MPAKTSNTGLVVALVLGAALLVGLGLAGATAFYFVSQEEDPKPIAVIDAGAAPRPPLTVSTTTTTTTTTTTNPTATATTKPPPAPARDAGSSPTPPPPPEPPPGPAAFSVTPSGERAGIDPDFPKFTAVVAKHGPSLESCFRQAQANAPEWSARIDVSFTKDGGRGVRVAMRRSGQDDKSPTAEQAKDCILPRVAMWPWPTPPGVADVDGGYPRLTMHARWEKEKK